MAVSRRLRFEILRRDGMTCRYCGAKAPDVTLTVDHVIPIALGGGDEPSNLVTACADCNAGKSSSSPDAALVEDVDSAALLFARARERATEIRRREIADADEIARRFYDWWDASSVDALPSDWRQSFDVWLSNGMNLEDLRRLVGVACAGLRRNQWKFFCGCVWREIGDRDEIARRLLEDQERAENPIGYPVDGDFD